jgi:DNA topoisomerase-1
MITAELLIKHFPKILDIQFTANMEEELDSIEEGKVNWVELLKKFYYPFMETLNQAQVTMKSVKKEVITTNEVCQQCGRPMVIKWGRNGKFISCSGFPKCKNAKPLPTGVKCPQANCGGDLVRRRSKQGRTFYGCSNYPTCTYVARKLPTPEMKSTENNG